MRRRKETLQVSTFPFLAVLLCAMGVLIMLLLVLDRRARVVAKARLRQATMEHATREDKAAQEKLAEWERRKQTLHAMLEEQELVVRDQLKEAVKQLDDIGRVLSTTSSETRQKTEKLQAERRRLEQESAILADRKREVSQLDDKSNQVSKGMEQMSADLRQLEAVLLQLKAARLRQQQTFSLIPYRGKRGDNRKPVYLECTANGVVFHPDRFAITGPIATAQDLRMEVERRVARQKELVKTSNGPSGDQTPYLLMLIRPTGITTYYQVVAALQEVKLDFGYEFIDADWVLDFPTDDQTPSTQPWMTAKSVSVPRDDSIAPNTAPRPLGLQHNVAPLTGTNSGFGQLTGERPSGRQQGSATGPILGPSNGGTGSFAGGGRDGGQVTSPVPMGRRGGSSQSDRSEGLAGSMPLGSGGDRVTGGGGSTAGAPAAIVPWVVPSNPVPGFAGGAPGTGGPGLGGGNVASTGVPAAIPTGGGPPLGIIGQGRGGAAGSIVEGESHQLSKDSLIPGSPTAGAANVPEQGPPPRAYSQPAKDGAAQPGAIEPPPQLSEPIAGADTQTAQGSPASPRTPGTVAAKDGAASGSAWSTGDAGEPGDPGERGFGNNLPRVPLPGPRKPRITPLRPSFTLGNSRDWIIPVECTASALVLQPLGPRVELGRTGDRDAAAKFTQAIQTAIARRQATVRAGEQPYRIQVRFLVRPDGLRSYYFAYPLLESLQLQMTRETLEQDEELTPQLLGR